MSYWYIGANLKLASVDVVDGTRSIIFVLIVTSPLALGVHQGRHEYDEKEYCWCPYDEGNSNQITKKDFNNGVVHQTTPKKKLPVRP